MRNATFATLIVGNLCLEIPIEVLEEANIDINTNKSGVEFQAELPIKFKSK